MQIGMPRPSRHHVIHVSKTEIPVICTRAGPEDGEWGAQKLFSPKGESERGILLSELCDFLQIIW